MSKSIQHFGTTDRGEDVDCLTLSGNGLTVKFLTLGAILQDVRLSGVDHSLTLGSNDLAAYADPMIHFGAIVGPVANRIAGAKATIDGVECHFPANENGVTTLHSGDIGIHGRVWTLVDHSATSAQFQLHLKDGEDGFPGNRTLTASYEITGPGALTMTLTATTDRITPINLANHSYWNMDGTDGTDGHVLKMAADHYLPVDSGKIPTGEIKAVDGTPFDFRASRRIGTGETDRFDHTFCLSRGQVPMRHVATLTGASGISMTLETTEPGLQVYDAEDVRTAPHLGYSGFAYGAYCGIAMESQGWPDAPNRPEFPQITLNPDQEYCQITRWTFRA